MNIFEYALLCIVFLLAGAGIAVWLSNKNRKGTLQDILSFSGAFLFAILILELFPAIFTGHHHQIGLFVLMGFFLQIGMDILTRGVEHGHLHLHEYEKSRSLILPLFLGLGVHALLDGLPFVGFDVLKESHIHTIYTGILLHKVAEGFTLFMVMNILGKSRNQSLLWIAAFSLITPIGMLLLQSVPFLMNQLNYVLAFAAGSLLHVSITILFESENLHHHGIAWRKLIWIALGIGLAFGLLSFS